MRFSEFRSSRTAKSCGWWVASSANVPTAPFDVYFEYPVSCREFVAPTADAFAAAMLVPAMKAGERLEIVPPISPRLHFNLPRIRDVFHTWHKDYHRIEIDARPAEQKPAVTSRQAATFFSGGVDSFFTLYKQRTRAMLPVPLTHVIFMRGIETELERIKGIEESEAFVKRVAEETGVQCIFGSTNIRTHFPLRLDKYCLGTALAATAFSLSRGFSHICIPSSFNYKGLKPHGTTPLVDEMFSTEALEIVHDGSETSRSDKVAAILGWKRTLVLNHLRVCNYNFGGTTNCGECTKCVRTAITLRVLGALDDANLFKNRSSAHWKKVARTDHMELLEENLVFAQEHADAAMAKLMTGVVHGRRRRAALREFVKNTPLSRLLWLAPKSWLR